MFNSDNNYQNCQNQSVIQITKINTSFIPIVNELANNSNLEHLLMQYNETLKKVQLVS